MTRRSHRRPGPLVRVDFADYGLDVDARAVATALVTASPEVRAELTSDGEWGSPEVVELARRLGELSGDQFERMVAFLQAVRAAQGEA